MKTIKNGSSTSQSKKRSTIKKRKKNGKRIWSSTLYALRDANDFSTKILPKLISNERLKIQSVLRVTSSQFNFLVKILSPRLTKQFVIRRPISVETRLAITLKHLAFGNEYNSLSLTFFVAPNTISQIISETCNAIIELLSSNHMQPPKTEDEWYEIANGFEKKWNFPNCVGALDIKHVRVKNFNRSGSVFFNRKGYYSILLMAIVDSNYRFIHVDVGKEGSMHDANAWRLSKFKREMDSGNLNFPFHAKKRDLPFVIIADSAFPLARNLMKPYPNADRILIQRKFNSKLSYARRVVENAFAILANRFRIFHRPMGQNLENVKAIVAACCILHNFIIDKTPIRKGNGNNNDNEWNDNEDDNELNENENDLDNDASKIRDQFAEYLYSN